MLRVDGACTSVSRQAAAGASGTESGSDGESDDGGKWEMNPGITWTLQHYEPGTKTSDGGAVFPCRVCAVQVVDSGDALERHVAWHEAEPRRIRDTAVAGLMRGVR